MLEREKYTPNRTLTLYTRSYCTAQHYCTYCTPTSQFCQFRSDVPLPRSGLPRTALVPRRATRRPPPAPGPALALSAEAPVYSTAESSYIQSSTVLTTVINLYSIIIYTAVCIPYTAVHKFY